MAIKIIRDDEVVPASGGATGEWAVGYMSADMKRVTDWHGHLLGTARVVTSWPLQGSYLSDRMFQVEATIDGRTYTGRTMGANMLWRGRVKIAKRQTPFGKREAGRMRREERRAVRQAKGVA